MRTVFSEFASLWPASRREALAPLLSTIPFFYYPEERQQMAGLKNPQDHIIIFNSGSITEIVGLINKGFEHCVQKSRADFSEELLASSLMLVRPKAFATNPLPFFFTGFSPSADADVQTHLSLQFQSTNEKNAVLDRLGVFFEQNNKLQRIGDLCIQVADELISNALFSAPVDFTGSPVNQNLERNSDVKLPDNRRAKVFACYSDQRVIVGCDDRYGTLNRYKIAGHLKSSFEQDTIAAKTEVAGGAGLGFRYMIENSANFYMYCDRNKRSLVAMGFLLEGMKANTTSSKHFHMSIR